MTNLVALILAVNHPAPPDVEQDGVRIATELRASVFRWTVTNFGSSPIVAFEVDHHMGYNFIVPEGWSMLEDPGVDHFRAWTDDPRLGIDLAQSGVFQHRGSSSGSDVGLVELRMERASGERVVVGGVWGTVPGPDSAVITVAATLCTLLFGHTWLLRRRERRVSSATDR